MNSATARRATSHFAVWGYILYQVCADARRFQRPHTPRSVREAFIVATRSFGISSPALRRLRYFREAERLSRAGLRRG